MIRLHDVEILNTREELIDPAHTAFLIIDMQNEMAADEGGYANHGFDISGIKNIVPTIRSLLDAARRLNLPIVYTEFVHRDRRGRTLMDGPNMYLHWNAEWLSDVVEGTWAAATLPDLAPRPEDVVIRKSTASAIYKTGLDNLLKRRGIRSTLLTGCLTDGCVLKTAVDLTHHGYYAVAVRDGVASLTLENHQLGLQYLEKKFPVFSSEEILAGWGSASL